MVFPLVAAAIEAAPAVGAAALRWAPAINTALGAIPLVRDIMKGGASPEKIAQVQKMRDDRIEQLIGADPSMNRSKATDQANSEFKDMIDSAKNEGTSAGEIAGDVAGLVSDAGMGYLASKGIKAGMKAAKKTNPNAPAAGGPTTATEGVNGTSSDPAKQMAAPAPSAPSVDRDALMQAAMKAKMRQRAAANPGALQGIGDV